MYVRQHLLNVFLISSETINPADEGFILGYDAYKHHDWIEVSE